MDKVNLTIEVDPQPFIDLIAKLNDLEGDVLFDGLSQISVEKQKIKDALELVESVETQVKQAINDKAKALYGNDWAAIKGNRYKITRSKTGSVYELVGKVEPEFTKVTIAPDSDSIAKFQLEHNALPEGVAVNEHRGESIRINVK